MATPLGARLLRWGLWALVAVGAVGGIAGAVRPRPTVVHHAAVQTAAAPAGLTGVAELVAREWLVGGGRPTEPGSSQSLTVDAVAVVAVRQIDSDYWAVTVAAYLRSANDVPGTTWFLEVGVADTERGPRPVGQPAIVPAPVTLTASDPASLALTVPQPGDPVATTTEAFLHALLTGAGDPVRYVAPGVDIRPIDDPPFTDVRLERFAILERHPGATRVRVALTGTTTAHVDFDVAYELTLAERDGRWEITAMNGAPTPARNRPRRPTTTAPTAPSTTTSATPGA